MNINLEHLIRCVLSSLVTKAVKRSPESATIKDHSPPLVPRGRVIKRETTTRGHTNGQQA